ncbi:MAG: transposase [bacterium]
MPRTARIAPRNHIFHILTRGNNRRDVFRDEMDYQEYLKIVGRYKEKYQFKIYHYVLMKNHVHLVLEPQDEGGSLAEIMKGINLSYVQYYKRKYNYVGHFWQDRFKSILISRDQYLLACGSYVELNPVRAGVVKAPGDYRWSSYGAYAYGKKDSLIDKHPIYDELAGDEAERRRRYREYVAEMLRNKEAMRGEMNRRAIYGSEGFVGRFKKMYQMEEIIKRIGRPRKKLK